MNKYENMKMRKFLLFLMALLCTGTAMACTKKANKAGDVTIIVTDTLQSLLPNAEVKAGKCVLKTSWDGRVVFTAAQVGNTQTATVSCDGFETKKINLNDTFLIVALTKSKIERRKDNYERGGKSESTKPYYRTLTKMVVEAEADGMVEVEERAGMMPEPMLMGATSKTDVFYSSPANNISAGKLTAGEVNDFAKWYFWPTVLDSTHKEFISDWRLEPRRRYTVQVMNRQGYPIANYPVQLTDVNGNTVFQAVTDNTGKAELWAGLIPNGQQQSIREPEQVIIVDEPCPNNQSPITNDPSDVDVMFVFDATGSMGDELRYLQAEMKDVIARASEATGGLTIRTGAVVYRDHEDEYVTRLSRLTTDITTTQSFIDKQHASGGGDYEEAVPEALMAALNSAGWNENARTRIAFLILDAPCHQDSVTLALLHEQILNAAAMGVRIVPVVCSGINESSEFLMRAIALATNGTSFFLTDDSGIGHSHLKPTTDSLKVEHLNDMLVRTIVEFSFMPECENETPNTQEADIDEQFIPNPFSAKELEADSSIPHGKGVVYLIDITGKLLGVYNIDFDAVSDLNAIVQQQLPVGVYFIKSFYDGSWHTRKILL